MSYNFLFQIEISSITSCFNDFKYSSVQTRSDTLRYTADPGHINSNRLSELGEPKGYYILACKLHQYPCREVIHLLQDGIAMTGYTFKSRELLGTI